MPNGNHPRAVRGMQRAMQCFQTEVAHELGFQQAGAEQQTNLRVAEPVITGELSKRMVELANQQLR